MVAGDIVASDQVWIEFDLSCGGSADIFDFEVEVAGNLQRISVAVWRQKACRLVVRQMDAIRTLIDENGHRRVGTGVGNVLRHLLHDQRIADQKAQAFCSAATGSFRRMKPRSKRANSMMPDFPIACCTTFSISS